MMKEENQRTNRNALAGNARPPCLSCSRPVRMSRERGARFCSACQERSQMKNIDALYDDIGGPG